MFRSKLQLKLRPRKFASFPSSCDLPPRSRLLHHHNHHSRISTNNQGSRASNLVDSGRFAKKFAIRNISSKSRSKSLATPPFQRLVQDLKSTNQTCTIIESSCGGLISSSLMSVPGSSSVYFGGTVAYNTKKSGKLLCGDEELHDRLLNVHSVTSTTGDIDYDSLGIKPDLSEEALKYVKSKIHWTRQTALSYCAHIQTDFAIAEGGATGPTFHPEGMETGFAVLAVAGRTSSGDIEILAQRVIQSTHANRELNMRLFADSAAELCLLARSSANPSISEAHATESNRVNDNADEDEGILLDRSSYLRSDDAIMKDFYQRQDSLHVIVRGTDEVLFATSTKLALPTLENILQDRTVVGTDQDKMLEKRTFLGRLGVTKTPVFAMFLPKDAVIPGVCSDAASTSCNLPDCYFANTRSHAPMLLPIHNELALTATAYVNWQNTHQFCHACGAPLEYIFGGTCAKCMNSNGKPHLHWPRQDPSIIVLLTNPDSTHALLARSPRHPPYLYTALAGFVEAGEDFESAVVREVHEEVGATVDRQSINYVASQPWPFPRSCMIGMRAQSLDGLSPIHIDPNEIVDAQWFEKETVYQAARDSDLMGAVLEQKVVEERQAKGEWSGKLLVPSLGVLARSLVDDWLESD